jgi:hypothetical protein
MPRSDLPLPPEELLARTGPESTPAQRLAALDAADPSRQRPKKVPCTGIVWTSWNGKRGKTLAFSHRPVNKSDEMALLIVHTTDDYRIFDVSGSERSDA